MILKHLGVSYLLAGLAFLVLVLRVFHPHHRWIALVLYGLSWIPFVRSIERRRALVRLHRMKWGGKLKTYAPHLILAVLLMLFLYVARVLVPVEHSPLTRMTAEELSRGLEDDADTVRYLDRSMARLLLQLDDGGWLQQPVSELTAVQKQELKGVFGEFLQTALELDLLQRKYKGFYQLDYVSRPALHARSFLQAFYAFVSLYRSSLVLVTEIKQNEALETLLNEPDFAFQIPENSVFDLNQNLTHPDHVVRLNAGRAYLQLMKKDLADQAEWVAEVEARLGDIDRQMGRHPEIFVNNPLEFLEHHVFNAWFPLQKHIAVQMSTMRTTRRDYFITAAQLEEVRARLQPGDILLQRRNWHITNVGIPGFWPHLALYTGTLEEMDAFFADAQRAGGSFSEAVRQLHPDLYAAYRTAGADARPSRVIEAKRDGVITHSFETSAGCDYLAVLRPRVSKAEAMNAVLNAFRHYGKPYDFNFDFATDNALVCSELICKAYEGAAGLTLEPRTLNGRLLFPPNALAEKFDDEFGSPDAELEFILFLDGSEAGRNAIERDAEAFRKTWRRPKWDIMQR